MILVHIVGIECVYELEWPITFLCLSLEQTMWNLCGMRWGEGVLNVTCIRVGACCIDSNPILIMFKHTSMKLDYGYELIYGYVGFCWVMP